MQTKMNQNRNISVNNHFINIRMGIRTDNVLQVTFYNVSEGWEWVDENWGLAVSRNVIYNFSYVEFVQQSILQVTTIIYIE